MQTSIDLEVISNALPIALGCGLNSTRRTGRRDRRRQTTVEKALQVADAQRSKDENLGLHACRAQSRAFFDIGARQQIGAGVLQRAPYLTGAVAVRVRFDNRDDSGRSGGRFLRKVLCDRPEVGFDRAQIDARDSRTNHGEIRI